uniref:Uncharacterized protein n=1 Tax=Glossina palpalis gambiensis TaxID=67801 RepID=A0A1B0BH22_9MUSC
MFSISIYQTEIDEDLNLSLTCNVYFSPSTLKSLFINSTPIRFDTKRFIKHDLPTPPSPKITTFNKVLLLGGRIFILTRCQSESSTN